jgi:DNA helicase-2/ATP-dependent DNA helicase PcrA
MDFELDQLNEKQREAVEHVDGPLLILAGAGSGKTRVITNRVAYLMQYGIDPSNILALSFTNKAADEMRERVAELTGPEMAEDVHLSTFHSLGANILRRDIDVLGYKKPFTILDQADQLTVVEDAMDDLNLDTSEIQPRDILTLISKAKMAFSEPGEMEELKYNPLRRFAQKIYKHYTRALRGLNAVDFDDLLCMPVELFEESERIRQKYGDRFQYVMVDEYQDTNETQLLMLQKLVKDHGNICVVGDDDQSIYGFRGAVAENILSFEKEFEDTKVIKLEQNYRSTNTILDAANGLIANNAFRKDKELWSAQGEGEPVTYVECEDGEEEADYVAAEIERMRSEQRLNWSDFAILYRVNPQSQAFEKALKRYGIPYEVRGSTEFFDRREVKDFVAYLKAVLNPADEISMRRIVNVPRRGIGPTRMSRISDLAREDNSSFFDALKKVADDPDAIEGMNHSSATKLRQFVETISEFHERLIEVDDSDGPTAEVCEQLLERVHLVDHVRSQEDNDRRARERIDNLEEVIASIREFDANSDQSVRTFLERMALDSHRMGKDSEAKNAVQLMTFHSSKGLEFPAVFCVGMEEHYIPHSQSIGREEDLAEERRLAYVGLTRAQQYLTLTSAKKRVRYGQELEREPSRFLEELPDETVVTGRARDRESMVEKRAERNEKHLDEFKNMIEGWQEDG